MVNDRAERWLGLASEHPTENGHVVGQLRVRSNHLPAPLTPLVGREQEVAGSRSLERGSQVPGTSASCRGITWR